VRCRRTLNPVAEIMPDRCTPEYERTVAKKGSLLPYRRARTLLAEFLPLGKPQAVETTRQRTLRVGTRLEQETVAGAGAKPSAATKSIVLSVTAHRHGIKRGTRPSTVPNNDTNRRERWSLRGRCEPKRWQRRRRRL
jgi:hypothetical protein